MWTQKMFQDLDENFVSFICEKKKKKLILLNRKFVVSFLEITQYRNSWECILNMRSMLLWCCFFFFSNWKYQFFIIIINNASNCNNIIKLKNFTNLSLIHISCSAFITVVWVKLLYKPEWLMEIDFIYSQHVKSICLSFLLRILSHFSA